MLFRGGRFDAGVKEPLEVVEVSLAIVVSLLTFFMGIVFLIKRRRSCQIFHAFAAGGDMMIRAPTVLGASIEPA